MLTKLIKKYAYLFSEVIQEKYHCNAQDKTRCTQHPQQTSTSVIYSIKTVIHKHCYTQVRTRPITFKQRRHLPDCNWTKTGELTVGQLQHH